MIENKSPNGNLCAIENLFSCLKLLSVFFFRKANKNMYFTNTRYDYKYDFFAKTIRTLCSIVRSQLGLASGKGLWGNSLPR